MLLALTVVLAVPAMAADQFDLHCVGEARDRTFAKPKPFDFRFRVDLVAGAWCRESCRTVQKIAAVEPGRIVFALHNEEIGNPIYSYTIVDRATGRYTYRFSDPKTDGINSTEEGACSPEPFSGFPKTQF